MPPKRGGKWANASPKPAARNRHVPPAQAKAWTPQFTKPSTHSDADGNGFSMRDEARNTQSHHSDLAWTSGDTKLREKPVVFVSAGFIEPLKDIYKNKDKPTMDTSPSENAEQNISEDVEIEITRVVKVVTTVEEGELVGPELTLKDRPDEEVSQDDEPEEIQPQPLFCIDLVGDKSRPTPSFPPPVIPAPKSSGGESDSSEEIILFRGRTAKTGTATVNIQTAPPAVTIVAPNPPVPQTKSTPSAKPREKRTKFSRSRSRGGKNAARDYFEEEEDENEEDEILADYIANMAANAEDDFISQQLHSFNSRRDLGGDNFAYNLGSGDEDDLPAVENLSNDENADSTGSGPSDAEEGDELDENDNEMDADMDDETFARLLGKQEELGMGGDDLILADSFTFTQSRAKNKNLGRSTGQASASAVADAFDELDLADWALPATRKRRSKRPPNFNVSDSEIEAALKSAWSQDRERKKNRKMEREALRAQGLLGKNSASSPEDLRVKYPMGFKLQDFKTELALFLVGSDERLEFPPLDKHARMVLHRLASKFNVKSQSTGKGEARRPVLYRTKRTITYKSTQLAEATRQIDAAAVRIGRQYFHRADVNPVKGEKGISGGGAARVSMKALVLREGEIVGASVPELGQENKGRAMLEKMGWSKGMALGSVENKGILEPVAQVVKKSKAGLGRTHTDW